MKRYTASLTSIGSARIISVCTDSEEQAKEEIARELGKPGRQEILAQWQRNGGHIIETTSEFAR